MGMEIGALMPKNLGVFRPLLLSDVANRLDAGEPILALAVVEDDVAIGAIAGSLKGEVFWISSLYVAPEYRRRGAGRMLVMTLEDLIKDDCGGTAISFADVDETDTFKAFLPKMEYIDITVMAGCNFYVDTISELGESPFFKRAGARDGVARFETIDGLKLRVASRQAKTAGMMLPEGGLYSPDIDGRVSTAIVRGGEIVGYAAFDRSFGGWLTLAAIDLRQKNLHDVLLLLETSYALLREVYPSDEQVVFPVVDDDDLALARVLAPKARTLTHTYAHIWEKTDKAD